MLTFFYVGVGGGIGSICRYLLSKFIDEKYKTRFPFSILLINILGSFLFSFFFNLAPIIGISEEIKRLITTGFCGGFSTWSTHSTQTYKLFLNNEIQLSILNLLLNHLLSFFFAFFGHKTSLLFNKN